MNKYIKKDCTFDDGYVWSKGNVVPIEADVVKKFNDLEHALQMKKYEATCQFSIELPEPFEFESMHSNPIEIAMPATPVMDAQMKESMDLMAEIDTSNHAARANALADRLPESFREFISKPYFLTNESKLVRFDTKTMGNPLKLTTKDIVKIVSELAE